MFVSSEGNQDKLRKEIWEKSITEVCPYIAADKGITIKERELNVKKTSFGIIMLGTIKAGINIEFASAKVQELQDLYSTSVLQNNFLLRQAAPLIQSFASLTDLTITMNELVLVETF